MVSVKEQFNNLRKLQKSFEDLFNTPQIYNQLKLALICGVDKRDKFNIIKYFMKNKQTVDTLLRDYTKWRLVGATHRQITEATKLTDGEETKEEKAQATLDLLSAKVVYKVCNGLAIKQLLRLNVEQDNLLNDKRGRKFDFSIWYENSLEHVHPKSKVYHKDGNLFIDDSGTMKWNEAPKEDGYISRDDFNGMGSEHCIGNLVLLYKNDNSKFSDSPFEEKKRIYFSTMSSDFNFKSRNLLHSISVFAKSEWGVPQIIDNRKDFRDRFTRDYKLPEGKCE
jgi:hypothetical protein